MVIRLHSLNGDCSESKAAEIMRNYIESTFPKDGEGTIDIISGINLPFGEVSDIDILVIANLHNCFIEYKGRIIEVRSFITAVELKEQDFHNIFIKGESVWVKYLSTKTEKNASDQNFKQKNTIHNYCLKHNLALYISRALWLKSISKDIQDSEMWPQNCPILCSLFSFSDLVEQVIKSGQKPYKGVLDAVNNKVGEKEMLESLVSQLTVPKPILPHNTQAKIANLISKKFENSVNKFVLSEQFVCIDGKAGTGKTFLLLQTALRLAEEGHSCSLLTYNNALVLDLKRLVSFLPTTPDIKSNLSIKTIHAYLHRIAAQIGWTKDNIDDKLLGYVKALWLQNNSQPLITSGRFDLDDYLLIDEAQDCTPIEKEIFEKTFGASRIIIAKSALQKIRRANAAHWGKPTKKLMEGLRQKSNIVDFLKTLTIHMGISDTCAGHNSAPGLEGGTVIIEKAYLSDTHIRLSTGCKESGGCDYDILVLVPPSLVENKRFKHSVLWNNIGINLIDGCSDTKILELYSNHKLFDSCRIFQYESCRGLEGWATVCLNLDEIIDLKIKQTKLDFDLSLNDPDIQKRTSAYQWIMMPLTRAVDTLVITVKDITYPIADILRAVAREHSDFVECYI